MRKLEHKPQCINYQSLDTAVLYTNSYYLLPFANEPQEILAEKSDTHFLAIYEYDLLLLLKCFIWFLTLFYFLFAS